jgi:SAM-dependent methyltransferase
MSAWRGQAAVAVDPTYGFRRLDPIPDAAEIGRFYESDYYDAIATGGRAPHIKRLIEGGENAREELRWLERTLYADVAECLRTHAPGTSVLDIGCGTGELLTSLARQGFDAEELDPAGEAADAARSQGLKVTTASLAEFFEADGQPRFDAVVMLDVLEYVPDPLRMLELARGLLNENGLIWLQVPNDFNQLQLAAQKALGHSEWWIAYPDHINYFDFESLRRVLAGLDLQPVEVTTDFPMELFLLLGFDYVADPALGGDCHRRRVHLELALPAEVRRSLSRALAQEGIGRNCRVAGRLAAR